VVSLNAQGARDMGVEQVSTTPESRPPVPGVEGVTIRELLQSDSAEMKVGGNWYLVGSKWYNTWKEYSGFSEDASSGLEKMDPGPIDNSALIEASTATLQSPRVKQHLQEGSDYDLVPECVWIKLQGWYGGGPALQRRVISEGTSNNYLRVEVFPLVLKAMKTTEQGKLDKKSEIEIEISKKATLDELVSASIEMMKIEVVHRKDSIRIWNFFSPTTPELITSPFINTLDEEKIVQGQLMVLEVKSSDGSWPLSNALTNNNKSSQVNESKGINGNDNNTKGSTPSKSEKKEKKKGKGLLGRITSIFSVSSDNSSSLSAPTSNSSSDGFSFSSLSSTSVQRGLCGLDNLGLPLIPLFFFGYCHSR